MRNEISAFGLALCCLGASATAQGVPELQGAWVETGGGGVVRRGQDEHQPSTDDIVFGGPLRWTLTVERQEGAVFSGVCASQNRSDPMVGAISANGTTPYMADDNGPMHGELRTADATEVCRSLADADTMLAMCRILERKR